MMDMIAVMRIRAVMGMEAFMGTRVVMGMKAVIADVIKTVTDRSYTYAHFLRDRQRLERRFDVLRERHGIDMKELVKRPTTEWTDHEHLAWDVDGSISAMYTIDTFVGQDGNMQHTIADLARYYVEDATLYDEEQP